MTAVEKITNGGFELGDLTGWTHNEAPNHAIIIDEPGDIYEGDYCLNLNNASAGYGSWISQNLSGSVIKTDSISTFRIATWFYSGITPNNCTIDVTLTYSDLSTSVEHIIPTISWVLQNISTVRGKTLTDIKIQLVCSTLGQTVYVDGISLMYVEPNTWDPYINIQDLKDRLLIETSNTTYDEALLDAVYEACNYVAAAHCPFVSTLPLENVTAFMVNYTADIAAGIFKRRMMPADMDTGWWAQGIEKLRLDIDSTYLYGTTFTWNSNNPEEIMTALDKKVINIKEARTLLQACTTNPTSENISYVEAQIDLINAQITKLGKDGLLVDAQELLTDAQELKTDAETSLITKQGTKLSGVDTSLITEQIAKITAEVTKLEGVDTNLIDSQIDLLAEQITQLEKQGSLTDAETLNVPKVGAKIDAETDVLNSQLDTMAAGLTKTTAENAVLTQQVLNLQADVTHLTALNGNLTAINSKLGAETTKIAGADTTLETAQSALLGSQKSMIDSQILTTSTIISSTLIWNPKDFEEARDIITASISKLTQAQVIEILRAVPRQKGFSYLTPPSEE